MCTFLHRALCKCVLSCITECSNDYVMHMERLCGAHCCAESVAPYKKKRLANFDELDRLRNKNKLLCRTFAAWVYNRVT